MSLRSVYSGALTTKLIQARDAGEDDILTNHNAAITTALTSAANAGKTAFSVSYVPTFQPNDLKLLGNLWNAYKTGVTQALAAQEIMVNEVSVALDTSTTTPAVLLNFTF